MHRSPGHREGQARDVPQALWPVAETLKTEQMLPSVEEDEQGPQRERPVGGRDMRQQHTAWPAASSVGASQPGSTQRGRAGWTEARALSRGGCGPRTRGAGPRCELLEAARKAVAGRGTGFQKNKR